MKLSEWQRWLEHQAILEMSETLTEIVSIQNQSLYLQQKEMENAKERFEFQLFWDSLTIREKKDFLAQKAKRIEAKKLEEAHRQAIALEAAEERRKAKERIQRGDFLNRQAQRAEEKRLKETPGTEEWNEVRRQKHFQDVWSSFLENDGFIKFKAWQIRVMKYVWLLVSLSSTIATALICTLQIMSGFTDIMSFFMLLALGIGSSILLSAVQLLIFWMIGAAVSSFMQTRYESRIIRRYKMKFPKNPIGPLPKEITKATEIRLPLKVEKIWSRLVS